MPTATKAKKKRTTTIAKKKKLAAKPKVKILGRVVHYYDRIGVAIVEVASTFSVGDTVRFRHGTLDYTQQIHSMQYDHKPITKAKKGNVVGIKVDMKTAEGAMVVPE